MSMRAVDNSRSITCTYSFLYIHTHSLRHRGIAVLVPPSPFAAAEPATSHDNVDVNARFAWRVGGHKALMPARGQLRLLTLLALSLALAQSSSLPSSLPCQP